MRQPDGSVLLRSRSVAYFGQTVRLISDPLSTAHACFGNNTNFVVSTDDSGATAFLMVDPLAPSSAYAAPSKPETVLIESLLVPQTYAQSCGGSVVMKRDTWNVSTVPFTLTPPVGCPSVCIGQTLSLRQSPNLVSLLSTDGSVRMVNTSSPSLSSANLVVSRQTVDGVSGWIVSTINDWQNGLILTMTPSTCSVPSNSACCAGGAAGLALLPVPDNGLSRAHLFKLFWADGSGELSSMPNVPAVAGQETCNFAPSASPRPSSTSSPSASLSMAPTPTATVSAGASPSSTPPVTGTSSVTPSPSVTATGTASAPSNIRIAGRLVIELLAEDFLNYEYPARWGEWTCHSLLS